jgi:hypothetical protein
LATNLTLEMLLKVNTEIASFEGERRSSSMSEEQRAAYSVANEGDFEELLNRLKKNLPLTVGGIDDSELAVAVSVICLSPESGNYLASQMEKTFVDFQEVYSVVKNAVFDNGFYDQPMLCRDVVIAWGNGWHRANFDKLTQGAEGRWIRSLLALTFLIERAVEHALRLLAHSVDRLFTSKSTDPDSPGHPSTISSYAGMLAASVAADCCDCGANKCPIKHRLSSWSPRAPNGRAFPLRAFAAQVARGDAGPNFHNKEFQNSALYPLLRDFHGLCFHEKVEFKLCHRCESKYEGNECRCGTSDDPLETKHILFENAFWVKGHKLYLKKRRQRCRRCGNLYSLREFKTCPLDDEKRTPNRDTKVFVLQQRLDSRAVLHPDYPSGESGLDELTDGWTEEVREPDLARLVGKEPLTPANHGVAQTPAQLDLIVLVAESLNSHLLTDAEASEITAQVAAEKSDSGELRRLTVRTVLGRLYDEATQLAEIASDLVKQFEDLIFESSDGAEDLECQVVVLKAKLLSRKGVAAGVMTPLMAEQVLTSSTQLTTLEDALERWSGLEQVVRTAQLIQQARTANLLTVTHAKQCLSQALRGQRNLDEIEDNSERICGYILSGLGKRIGVIEESEAWSIQDAADNCTLKNQTLAELKQKIEARSSVVNTKY